MKEVSKEKDLGKLMLMLIKEIKEVKKQNQKIADHQALIGQGFGQFLNSNVLLTAHVREMAKSISDFSEQYKMLIRATEKLDESFISYMKMWQDMTQKLNESMKMWQESSQKLNESIESLKSVLTRPPEEEEEDSYIV